METKKIKNKKNRTVKLHKSKQFEQEITNCFLEMLIAIKLFHWNTFVFAQHEASDKLYTSVRSKSFKKSFLSRVTSYFA